MARTPIVSGLFPPPDRETSLKAISRALLRIRSNGWSATALGEELGCSADTIEAASNERSLLRFDCIALLAFKFPEEFSFIEQLWSGAVAAEPTVADRLERIEREVEAIRNEAA